MRDPEPQAYGTDLQEQNLVGEPLREGRHTPRDRIGQDGELVAPEARRHQDDPGVDLLAVDQLTDELEEVGHVSRDQAAPLSGRKPELLEIAEAYLADLVGSGGVQTALPKQRRDPGREILAQVELQPARGISPGYRATTPSAVRAAFSSIRRWISSR